MTTRKVASLMARYGFDFLETGGGCTAYASEPHSESRTAAGWGFILLTQTDDPMAPDSVSDPVTVSIYDDDNRNGEELAILRFPDLPTALRALSGV